MPVSTQSELRPLELWGGIECTVNRAGDCWHDQLELSGHASRLDDIDRIASLGIKTLRYPLLWERLAPVSGEVESWRWADERMDRLAALGIEPIVGLVHHGSGPSHTSLLDPHFPEKLAAYSASVAERYPQIKRVTPVNEPLTTARFSTLYGHWYPHETSPYAFADALLNQCVAIRQSLAAMRRVIPDLQLIQTEDLGRVHATPALSYQAEFENERRWLTFDLLCGKVDERHPMWPHLALDKGKILKLKDLSGNPCPPDILGINYYVTSERFLDDRIELHHDALVGGNGRHRYADLEAVRALRDGITGHATALMEAWERYGVPIAITEVHLGCTREHQMRWLQDAWNDARAARHAGADVRSVTAWALFGSFGWDTLVTRPPFRYEVGAFDVSARPPRETGLGKMIRRIISGGSAYHAVADQPGWWQVDDRLAVTPPDCLAATQRRAIEPARAVGRRAHSRPVLITGARGTLGSALVRICRHRGIAARGLDRRELDICDPTHVRDWIDKLRPWAVVNAAGFVRVDDAEYERAECYRGNTVGAGVLADECARAGIRLVTFSSDLVFDGKAGRAYVESDQVSPLNTYGASKAAAEVHVLAACEHSLVIRTSAFFGPWDTNNFPAIVLATLARGLPFVAAGAVTVSPTYVPDLVHSALDLLIDEASGIWHLANQGAVTWGDFAREVAQRAGLSVDLITETPVARLGRAASIPAFSVLGTEHGCLLPALDDALNRFFLEAPMPALESFAAFEQ